MSDFRIVQDFLRKNDVTADEMDKMWAFMYDKNWLVKNLTDNGEGWSDLNTSAMKSLIKAEIKFRGKRVDNGEWIYGYYVEDEEGSSILYRHPLDGSLDRKQVIPETVGQYIRLHDKNGKEIFENDICRQKQPSHIKEWIGKVKINPTQGVILGTESGSWWPIWIHDVEVIGNIHDNPELLKGESI